MPRSIVAFVLAFSLLFVGGCGTKSGLCKPNRNWSVTFSETNPTTQEIIGSVPPNASAVTFIRFPQFVMCAGRMFAQLDGEEIGPVATHTHVVVYVSPGEHEVTASAHSIWDVDKRSFLGRLRVETFPGRAYFISGAFDEGSVALRLLSTQEADALIKESRRILTPQQMEKK